MKKVFVQMGHVAPRQPGHEDETGTNGEIEFVSKVGVKLAAFLSADKRLNCVLAPGKMPSPAWTGDMALFLHADGAAPSAHGYSLGWPPEEFGPKTHRMRGLLVQEYEKLNGHPSHHTDNYTADMREYYGFHHLTAPVKILIEHGFLTNPTERAWLNDNTDEIAKAWYSAIVQYFNLTAAKPISKLSEADAQRIHAEWALGEGKFKQYGPFEGPRPKELDTKQWNPAPIEWYVALVKKLKNREKEV